MTTWNIDNSHSGVHFTVRHMVFAKVRGHFAKWTAALHLDPANLAASNVSVDVDGASITTNEDKRDAHLRSADFFDVEKFPKMTFQSKKVEGSAESFKITGDLTMHGVTKEVVLDCEQTGTGKDPWGNQRIVFSGKASLNRADFGLTWNAALETGGVIVSEKVDIDIEIEAVGAA